MRVTADSVKRLETTTITYDPRRGGLRNPANPMVVRSFRRHIMVGNEILGFINKRLSE